MHSTSKNNPASTVLPDSTSSLGKKQQVAEMFNNIAGRYDFLNHFLSLGIDKTWRNKAIKEIASVKPVTILDVATGTGDLAITASRIVNNAKITGVDIADQMLDEGRKKIAAQNLTETIKMQLADSEALPFAENSFDAVMCAYGVRNFENLEAGLSEMQRVMRPGGKLAILEFSRPASFPVKQLYTFYFKNILPAIGGLLSRHKTAYTYLPESVNAFPDGKNFCDILTHCGFKNAHARPLTLGVTTLYTATK